MTEIEVRVRQNGKPYLRARLSESPATIGRDPEADVHLDSTAVSRVHARLFFDDQGIRIVDAGSTNGLRINGIQHARADIAPNAIVTICDFAIRARRIVTAVELGEELSEGWFEPEAEDESDTYAGERAPDTHVGDSPEHHGDSMPSVRLGLEDVVVEASTAEPQDSDRADEPYEHEEPPPEDAGDEASDDVDVCSASEKDDDEADDIDAERVPTDVPAIVSVMRNAAADIDTAGLTRFGVAIEVLVCVGSRLHDVALVKPGDVYWWGEAPGFPASLWTVPTLDHFPLVTHCEPGIYDVQVPQDSTWKMFHRGDSKAATYRSGQLVGMRVGWRESAEISYGPYAIYVRCVNAPAPLTKRFDFRRYVPTPVVVMAVMASVLINFAVVAMPGKRPHFLSSPIPEEEYTVHEVAFQRDKRPEIPVPELEVEVEVELPPELAQTQRLVKEPEQVKQSVVAAPVNEERPALLVKPQKRPKIDPNAGVTTIEAVRTPKQPSINDFQVSGLTHGVAEPMIERGKSPPISGGTALLRGEHPGQTTTSVIDKSGATGNFTIIPPGRLESEDVKRAINRHGMELKRCHDANLDANGKLDMQWVVNQDGTVRNVRVVLDELRSPEMTKCVRDAVAKWTFPLPKGGDAVVAFPFRFTNENL